MQKPRTTKGNHHLATIVIALTAIFLALGIYTYTLSRSSTRTTGTNLSDATDTRATNTQALDTVTGTTSFTGTIKSLKGRNQLIVSTVVVAKGVPTTKTLIVNFTERTAVMTFAYAAGASEVTKTPTDASVLKDGLPVQIHTNEVVGSTSPLTARSIDILPS